MSPELRTRLVALLLVLFANVTLWVGAALALQFFEGGYEAAYKCGVKRVRRDFISVLWNETSTLDEFEWKSSARRRLVIFEDELHEAVEAGVASYSGQKVWRLPNAVLYAMAVASTVGTPSSSLHPVTLLGRLFSAVLAVVATTVYLQLVVQLVSVTLLSLTLFLKRIVSRLENLQQRRAVAHFFGESLIEGNIPRAESPDMSSSIRASVPCARFSTLLLLVYLGLTTTVHALTTLSNPVDSAFVAAHSVATVGFFSSVASSREAVAAVGLPRLVYAGWTALVGVPAFVIFQVSNQVQLYTAVDKLVAMHKPKVN